MSILIMHRTITLSFILFSLSLSAQTEISKFIHYDQFGYLPEQDKVAVLSDPIEGYNATDSYVPTGMIQLVNATTNEVVYEALPTLWKNGNTHTDSGDRGWWFDFSSVTTPGTYYIKDANSEETSGKFNIDEYIYSTVLKTATKMFYYNRCNFTKDETYAGANYADGMNFMNPGQDGECKYLYEPNNSDLFRDLSGGWWDAGDYNKYVTLAASAVHNLLSAYEENPSAFGDDFNIPESDNSIPDIIDEIKYELDWLLKMCNDDGSVHIKMGSIAFDENVESRPSDNVDPRYYGPTCTSASISAATMLLHAALVMRGIEGLEGYAAELGEQAEKCFEYVQPFIANGTLEVNCDDQTINAGDADHDAEDQRENALTAAIYLFELTNDQVYNEYIETHFSDATTLNENFWGPYRIALGDALLRYAKNPTATASLSSTIFFNINNSVAHNNNGFFGFNGDDLYRSFMPAWSYHWGSNYPKAGYSLINGALLENNIASALHASFEKQISENIHYFHGVNPLGLVLLSNMYPYGAEQGINEIYHTWFYDGTEWDNSITSDFGPASGYVTGGPNKDFSINTISPPANNPPQKSYLDFNTGWPANSWEVSEPAIYYQAAYIRMLAHFTRDDLTSTSTKVNETLTPLFSAFPNPAISRATITIDFNQMSSGDFKIFNIYGTLLDHRKIELQWKEEFILKNAGIFLFQFENENGRVWVEKIIIADE